MASSRAVASPPITRRLATSIFDNAFGRLQTE
jgi:hypothetical protein